MHFDTRLFVVVIIFVILSVHCQSDYTDEQSYLSLIEFNRGGPFTNLIFSSPHGGFLGANLSSSSKGQGSTVKTNVINLLQLPTAGCYNNTLERCVYTLKDCLRPNGNDGEKLSFHADARCVTDRSSSPAMYTLTKAIAEVFTPQYRPFIILNKLTRQYLDPAEDLLLGTFLLETATRSYMDYHRFIAMAKESIRSPTRGLFIEFVFHKHSNTVKLGYGFDISRSSTIIKPAQSTINELLSRSGPSVITGNSSFGHYLRHNDFQHVVPSEQQSHDGYRSSTHSTRIHADQRFNSILFSYPIERLRTHSLKQEAMRIAKAIEQFAQANHIKALSSSTPSFTNTNVLLGLFLLLHVVINSLSLSLHCLFVYSLLTLFFLHTYLSSFYNDTTRKILGKKIGCFFDRVLFISNKTNVIFNLIDCHSFMIVLTQC